MANAPTGLRNKVKQLVTSDIDKAATLAAEINDPWFKSQALAFVADKIGDRKRKEKILEQSFSSALEADSPNRIVSVSSWPLRVLSKSKEVKLVNTEVNKLINILEKESHPVRKLDALLNLIHALHHGPIETLNTVVKKYIEIAEICKSWKKDTGLYEIALLIKKHDLKASHRLINLIWDDVKKKKALKDIENGELIKNIEKAIDLRYE